MTFLCSSKPYRDKLCCFKDVNISIEPHFVGVHGPCELHRKEKQVFMHRVRLKSIFFYKYFKLMQ